MTFFVCCFPSNIFILGQTLSENIEILTQNCPNHRKTMRTSEFGFIYPNAIWLRLSCSLCVRVLNVKLWLMNCHRMWMRSKRITLLNDLLSCLWTVILKKNKNKNKTTWGGFWVVIYLNNSLHIRWQIWYIKQQINTYLLDRYVRIYVQVCICILCVRVCDICVETKEIGGLLLLHRVNISLKIEWTNEIWLFADHERLHRCTFPVHLNECVPSSRECTHALCVCLQRTCHLACCLWIRWFSVDFSGTASIYLFHRTDKGFPSVLCIRQWGNKGMSRLCTFFLFICFIAFVCHFWYFCPDWWPELRRRPDLKFQYRIYWKKQKLIVVRVAGGSDESESGNGVRAPVL